MPCRLGAVPVRAMFVLLSCRGCTGCFSFAMAVRRSDSVSIVEPALKSGKGRQALTVFPVVDLLPSMREDLNWGRREGKTLLPRQSRSEMKQGQIAVSSRSRSAGFRAPVAWRGPASDSRADGYGTVINGADTDTGITRRA